MHAEQFLLCWGVWVILSLCMGVPYLHAWYLQKLEEGFRSLGVRVSFRWLWDPMCVLGIFCRVLDRKQVLLTIEPSHQLPGHSLNKCSDLIEWFLLSAHLLPRRYSMSSVELAFGNNLQSITVNTWIIYVSISLLNVSFCLRNKTSLSQLTKFNYTIWNKSNIWPCLLPKIFDTEKYAVCLKLPFVWTWHVYS